MANDELTFYQVVPVRELRRIFVLAAIGLAIDVVGWYFYRPVPIMNWLEPALIICLLVVLVPKILYMFALRNPMLILTPSHLVYRKIRIPWNLVLDIQEVSVPTGPCLGIVLTRSNMHSVPLKSIALGLPEVAMGELFRRDMSKHGAILIPPAREASLSAFREKILDYRDRVESKDAMDRAK